MTNKDFFEALKDLEAEKGINEEVFISALEQALTAAYKKNSGMAKNAQVKLNPEKNTIRIYSYRTVVSVVEDEEKEISLEDAKQIKHVYKLGDLVMQEEISLISKTKAFLLRAKPLICGKMYHIQCDLFLPLLISARARSKLLLCSTVKRLRLSIIFYTIPFCIFGIPSKGLTPPKIQAPSCIFRFF